MAGTRYEMYCAVARALEVLGERWTLLLVRELLTGPKRFADLQAGLPGIASNMLTDRLRSLQDAGAVTQHALPPPAPATVYRLTERGEALRPVLHALAGWGLPLLAAPRPDEQFRLAWLMVALDGSYDPATTPEPITIAVTVDGETIAVHAHGQRHEVTVGVPDHADLRLTGDRLTFLAWATGQLSDREARRRGLSAVPARGTLTRLRRMYRIAAAAPPVS